MAGEAWTFLLRADPLEKEREREYPDCTPKTKGSSARLSHFFAIHAVARKKPLFARMMTMSAKVTVGEGRKNYPARKDVTLSL